MRCLKCWSELDGDVAIFTKLCHHVFCERCSRAAFKKELSCPLCDTVLPKDGIGEIRLRPDDSHIRRTSETLFGLEPDKLCDVLQLSLQFWAKQQRNEALKHVLDLKHQITRAEEAEVQTLQLSKTLEDRKLQLNSLQTENEMLQRHMSDLETRYAEKGRSLRKLSELYSELRHVHRQLELDLRGTHAVRLDTPVPDDDVMLDNRLKGKTGQGRRGLSMQVIPKCGRKSGAKSGKAFFETSDNISRQERFNFEESNSINILQRYVPCPSNPHPSIPAERHVRASPSHEGRPFQLNRRIPREGRRERRTRDLITTLEESREVENNVEALHSDISPESKIAFRRLQ